MSNYSYMHLIDLDHLLAAFQEFLTVEHKNAYLMQEYYWSVATFEQAKE